MTDRTLATVALVSTTVAVSSLITVNALKARNEKLKIQLHKQKVSNDSLMRAYKQALKSLDHDELEELKKAIREDKKFYRLMFDLI